MVYFVIMCPFVPFVAAALGRSRKSGSHGRPGVSMGGGRGRGEGRVEREESGEIEERGRGWRLRGGGGWRD